MRMPGMSGLDVLNALAARDALPPTIILTTFDDDQLVLAGLKAGARGYLLKDVSLDQLVDAVKTVAAGGSLVAPVVTQRLLSGLERMHNEFTSLDRPDRLTERETEILRLMAGGYSNKEIANSLERGRGHGEEPRFQHPVQARRARSHAGRAQGVRDRHRLSGREHAAQKRVRAPARLLTATLTDSLRRNLQVTFG